MTSRSRKFGYDGLLWGCNRSALIDRVSDKKLFLAMFEQNNGQKTRGNIHRLFRYPIAINRAWAN